MKGYGGPATARILILVCRCGAKTLSHSPDFGPSRPRCPLLDRMSLGARPTSITSAMISVTPSVLVRREARIARQSFELVDQGRKPNLPASATKPADGMLQYPWWPIEREENQNIFCRPDSDPHALGKLRRHLRERVRVLLTQISTQTIVRKAGHAKRQGPNIVGSQKYPLRYPLLEAALKFEAVGVALFLVRSRRTTPLGSYWLAPRAPSSPTPQRQPKTKYMEP
jgi:hypothetical protein